MKIKRHQYYVSDFDHAGDHKVMACFEHIQTGMVACPDPKKQSIYQRLETKNEKKTLCS